MARKNKLKFSPFFIVLIFIFLIVFSINFLITGKNIFGFVEGEESNQKNLEVRDLYGEEIVIEGKLETIVYEEMDREYEYFINSDGERIKIDLPFPVVLDFGELLRVEGTFSESGVFLSRKLEVVPLDSKKKIFFRKNFFKENFFKETDSSETFGEQRVAIILVRFNDSSNFPFTVQNINGSIFDGPVQDFFKENSFDKMWLNGNTFGWYTLEKECADALGGWVEVEEAIAISDQDIYFPDFGRVIIISDTFCNSAPNAYASVGKVDLTSDDGLFRASYVNIRNSVFFYENILLPSGDERKDGLTSGLGLIIHEFGHNLGAWHANNWDCGEEILYADCSYGNYGNFYDIMGRGWITGTPIGYGGIDFEMNPNAAFHFNSLMKREFKWLEEGIAITQNGTYSLGSLEKDKNSLLKIMRPEETVSKIFRPYVVEYRVPFGYDSSLKDPLSQGNLGGIFVNRQERDYFENLIPQTLLLDMSPNSFGNFNEDWYNVALLPNETFFDEGFGVRIANLGKGKDNRGVDISVEFYEPKCVRVKPKISLGDFPGQEIENIFINPGQTIDVGEELLIIGENKDIELCSDSMFEFIVDVPESWEYSFEPFFANLSSGEMIVPEVFEITAPLNASLEGAQNIFITFTNLDTNLSHKVNIVAFLWG